MTVTTAIAVGLVAWLVLGTGLALLVGGMVGRRDRQRYGRVDVPRPRPAADDQEPAADDHVSATDDHVPAGADQEPAGADQEPAGADQEPATDDHVPAGTDQEPAGADLRAGADRSARGPAVRGPGRARD